MLGALILPFFVGVVFLLSLDALTTSTALIYGFVGGIANLILAPLLGALLGKTAKWRLGEAKANEWANYRLMGGEFGRLASRQIEAEAASDPVFISIKFFLWSLRWGVVLGLAYLVAL